MNNQHYVSAQTSMNMQRSTFVNKPHTLTTMNVGKLVPIKVIEVMPNSTFKVDVKSLVRSLTPLNPTMSNAYVSVIAIYTPFRVVNNRWYNVLGENDTTAWTEQSNVEVPTCSIGGKKDNKYFDAVGSLGHHLGLPLMNMSYFEQGDIPDSVALAKSNFQVSSMYKRIYCENWNEWFRDQNTQAPIIFSKELNESYSDFAGIDKEIRGGKSYTYSSTNDTWTESGNAYYSDYSENNYSCYLLPTNKRHDYFTSAYPTPQKGEAQEFIDMFLPVLSSDTVPEKYDLNINNLPDGVSRSGLTFDSLTGTVSTGSVGLGIKGGVAGSTTASVTVNSDKLTPSNLFAYTGNIGSATINKLRQNLAVQHWLENSARGGSRRNEILEVHFHVKTNPLTLNKSRYLGGFEFKLNAQTAVATAESENYTVGSTGGYMAAGNVNNLFTFSADEHGAIMIYATCRTEQIYSQGVDKMWLRKDRYDFYWPEFQNLGAQIIKNSEVFLSGTSSDDEVFAYNDYADEYRTEVNKVSGYLDPVAPSSLSSWTYANNFADLPAYGADFIKESQNNFDRTLAVSSRLTDQLFADFQFDIQKTLPMPLASIPGLSRI